MEFLLGNPYSTPVGQCIERATDGGLQNEDWTLNMEICDIINETDEGPKDAMRALKKRLSGNKNYREVMLALTVTDGTFHVSFCSPLNINGNLSKKTSCLLQSLLYILLLLFFFIRIFPQQWTKKIFVLIV
uniref:Target of myb1 like 2 membrane trafficking protein n=1 Tax=Amphilophus citrinellus TaxID=61819 RepID=A0A3Q0RHV9_AMPCI